MGFFDNIDDDTKDKLVAGLLTVLGGKKGGAARTNMLREKLDTRRQRRKEKALEKEQKEAKKKEEKRQQGIRDFMSQAIAIDTAGGEEQVMNQVSQLAKDTGLDMRDALGAMQAFGKVRGELFKSREGKEMFEQAKFKFQALKSDRDYEVGRRKPVDFLNDEYKRTQIALMKHQMNQLQKVQEGAAKNGGVPNEKDLIKYYGSIFDTVKADVKQFKDAKAGLIPGLELSGGVVVDDPRLKAVLQDPKLEDEYLSQRTRELWAEKHGTLPLPAAVKQSIKMRGQKTPAEKQVEERRARLKGLMDQPAGMPPIDDLVGFGQ